MDFIVRFAPSPTGQVHIGNIRTAIFNWLAARHQGGKFLLRIEDTDLERSTKEAIDTLLACMRWLGLDYDGEAMYQTSQLSVHRAAAERLRSMKRAYFLDEADPEHSPLLFRIPYHCDGFPFVRAVGPATIRLEPGSTVKLARNGLSFLTLSAKGKSVENQACLAGFRDLVVSGADGEELYRLDDAKADALLNGGTEAIEGAAALSFLRREAFFDDIVKGRLAKPLDGMRDFIIVRSDGSPVFHLANVCDDVTQGVNCIIRGDDHVENTYRHLFLFEALGAEIPSYAHLPMIVNAQGKPYSKRDGDAFVGDFQAKGVLPEALFNYLTLLGWSPGDNREKMTRQEMIEAFQLERAQRSPARFDSVKLTDLNGQYVAELPADVFDRTAWDFAAVYDWRASADRETFRRVATLMQSRTKLMTDLAAWRSFFLRPEGCDPKARKKFLDSESVRAALERLIPRFAERDLSSEEVASVLRAEEEASGMKRYSLAQPLRVAATGLTVGAGIEDTVSVIGTKECAERIRLALEWKQE